MSLWKRLHTSIGRAITDRTVGPRWPIGRQPQFVRVMVQEPQCDAVRV